MNPDHYAYRVIWSAEDEEFVALCAEFPSLSWLENSPEEAFSGIRRLVAEVLEDMLKGGETPLNPSPDAPTAVTSWSE